MNEKAKLKPFISKAWWKKSNQRTMGTLSDLSKAFLLPIALLPIAGIFLGIGATISSKVDHASVAWYFGNFLNKIGDIAFGNLPVLFCISVAMAYTKDAGVAALNSVIGFLVFNAIQFSLLSEANAHIQYVVNIEGGTSPIMGLTVDGITSISPTILTGDKLLAWMKTSNIYKELVKGDVNTISIVSSTKIIDKFNLLFYTGQKWSIQNKLLTSNLGINSLNTGVFGGIIIGAAAAVAYNRFYKTQLPSAFSFFSGTKLIPIIMFIVVIPLSFIFMIIWPLFETGLTWFGNNSEKLPVGLSSLIFEIFERSLVPFGLHHVFYSPLWWTQAGGSMADLITNVSKNPLNYVAFLKDLQGYNYINDNVDLNTITFGVAQTAVTNWISELNASTISAVGDQTIMYKIISDPKITFTIVQHMGLNLGQFQSGKFPFMMFGLPSAAAAMYFSVPKENRKQVMGIYFSSAFTCFLTGITEPIEFTFLFVAPWLFYGIHMPLCAISFMLMGLLHVHTSMTVSGGFIDFIIFGVIPFFGGKGTNFYWIFLVGIPYIGIYFAAFYFAIKYGKIKIPGCDDGITKLYTKADFKTKEKSSKIVSTSLGKKTKKDSSYEKREKSLKIIEFLGGPDNINNVDSCASRLRITVVDNKLINQDGIKSLGGSSGMIIQGQSIQIIYGGEQEVIKPYIRELLDEMRNNKKTPNLNSK